MAEFWDLYNERRERTGKIHVRGQQIPQGYYHLVVHVWIRNRRGEYLIAQRSADRPAEPREKGQIAYSVTGRVVDGVRFTDIVDAWLFEYDGEADLNQATTQEVAQVKWMTWEQIMDLYQEKQLVHTLGYFFSELDR